MKNLALLLLLTLAACELQPRTGDDNSINEVRATQSARFDAMIANDFDALERILAPDLVYTHTTGSVDTREEFIESLRDGSVRYESVDVTDNTIRVAGDVATSTGAADFKVSAGSQRLELSIRFIEVYVREDDTWRLIAWQSTRSR